MHVASASQTMTTQGRSETDRASGSPKDSGTVERRPLVLLVEDDADTLAYMGVLLGSRYRVVSATSATEARQVLERRGPEVRLVLMDLSLRGPEDGLDLTSWLRSHGDWRRSLPVVAVTAHAFPADRERALAAGCDRYVAKPFARRELFDLIESLLGEGGVESRP
jgi:CheY-like chemotaxis protein